MTDRPRHKWFGVQLETWSARGRRRFLAHAWTTLAAVVVAHHLFAAVSPVAIAGDVVNRADGPPCPLESFGTRSVSRLVDVETLALDDGSEVRLAGVIVPRAIDVGAAAGTWPPEEAARAALAALTLGRAVRLWGAGTGRDRYGRLLAQVGISDGESPDWLQRTLLARGHARLAPHRGMADCASALLPVEHSARAARAGLWATPAYEVHGDAAAADFERLTGTFQIVRATVLRVSRGRDGLFLSLAPRPRGRDSFGLAAFLPHATITQWDAGTLAAAAGRLIEVRGWIEQRRGPVIAVELPEQLWIAPTGESAARPD